MDPVLVLSEPVARVDPGGEARIPVTVRNVGDLVEQYQFEVLGAAARWSAVLPRQVSVLPHGQEEKTVEVVFRPPRAPAAPSGEIPFGVRCVSLERRDRCAVVEGDVTVGAVHDLAARLEPVTPRGRWTGRYRVRFDNTGSVPVTLALAAADNRQLLRFALAPTELTVAPGQSTSAYLAVRPRQPMMRGKPVEHPFTLSYRADTGTAGGTDAMDGAGGGRGGELAGSFEQRPIVGKAALALGLVTALLAAGGGVLLLRSKDTPAGPKATDGPPPPTALLAAARLTDTSVQVVWQRSPYATGYVVQQVQPDGSVSAAKEVTDPDQSTVVWTDLKVGKNCFRVLTVGKAGRSAPSAPRCATLTAAPVTAPPATTAPPTSAAPSGGPSGGPTPSGPGGPGGPGGSGAPGGPVVLAGYYIIYVAVAQDDAASQGTAEGIASRLQQAGSEAYVVDSLKSDQLGDGVEGKGLWVVVQDGFSTFETARSECLARRGIAPRCYVVRP